MSPPVRMIAADLDRTLFSRQHEVSPRTVQALRAARDAGIVIVAATGRAPLSAMARLAHLDVIDMLVCSNGSLIHDPRADVTTDRFVIDPSSVRALFDVLDVALPGVSFCWEMPSASAWDDGFHAVAVEHDDLRSFAPAPRPGGDADITKLMVLHPTLERDALVQAIRDHVDVPISLACSGVRFVEATGAGIDKAHALGVVSARHGIDAADVIAFGDNHNDIAMLRWAGTGVAVSNAHPEAKLAADVVIGDHDDDAVAIHIESILG